jgi:hypothetical protein
VSRAQIDSPTWRRHADLVSSPTPPSPDEPLPTLEGRILAFGLALSAADILDGASTARRPSEARRFLFAGLDPGLAARLAVDDVVTAEEITGTAETARPALAALAAAGIRALVARRFADVVLDAAPACGIVTLVVDAPSFLHTDDRVRLDLDAGKIVNLSSGDRSAIRNLTDAERTRFRAALATRPAS